MDEQQKRAKVGTNFPVSLDPIPPEAFKSQYTTPPQHSDEDETKKYFVTVTYRNWLAPTNSKDHWANHVGLMTSNGYITMHPVLWMEKQYKRAREAWDNRRDHTSFEAILFYVELDKNINTDYLQDLS